MMQERSDLGETVDQLSRAEHLLVWAMRAIALGQEDCPTVVRTFRSACGARGDQMLQAYTIFIRYLALASARRLQIHIPGSAQIGADEATVLAIISAGQRSLYSHDETGLRRTLAEMDGAPCDDALVFVVQKTASLLAASGLRLNESWSRQPPSTEAPQTPSLH